MSPPCISVPVCVCSRCGHCTLATLSFNKLTKLCLHTKAEFAWYKHRLVKLEASLKDASSMIQLLQFFLELTMDDEKQVAMFCLLQIYEFECRHLMRLLEASVHEYSSLKSYKERVEVHLQIAQLA